MGVFVDSKGPGRKIYAVIVGVGGVGTQVIAQLPYVEKHQPAFHVALIANSKRSLSVPAGNIKAQAQDSLNLTSWQINLQQASPESKLSLLDVFHYAQSLTASHKAVLIDNTSSQEFAQMYSSFLSAGISVVTPNKKGFSSDARLWSGIFSAAYSQDRPQNGFVYHESTVGAGLPVISTLNDLVATGDRVQKIEGVFSGTMSFLFNTFAPVVKSGDSPPWSQVVLQAKKAGFTEPDPRDDLNGVDVARKLVILARIAGLNVEGVTSFPVESLIPAELKDAKSGEEFLERLPGFDKQMDSLKSSAEAAGKVIRFAGSIDFAAGKLKVGLEQFDASHPIAGLTGSDNIVSFHTQRYKSSPLVIQGSGAGSEVTAMGVTSDLLKVLQRLN